MWRGKLKWIGATDTLAEVAREWRPFDCSWLQVFNYERGQHNVVQIASPDCSLPNSIELAGFTDQPFKLVLNTTGTTYYA